MNAAAFESLRNHFLIAMPGLSEGIFAHSVTYLCDHSEEGAMGIVINQPLDLRLADILRHLQIEDHGGCGDAPVMAGGPVQTDRGFILHTPTERAWDSTLPLTAELALTSSRDILAALACDQGPADTLVALGYAGWGAGQLESELAANAWLTLPADTEIIFRTPIEKRLDAAAAKLGIDLRLLAPGAGHA
jgi:putative transcriptional regulator